jgi:hypothetical protein
MAMRYHGVAKGCNVPAQEMTKGLFIEFIMPFCIESSLRVTSSDLSDMKRDAGRHKQLMLLYCQMMRNRERIEPQSVIDDFLDELKPAYHTNLLRSVKQELRENSTADLLSSEGIPSVLLRGNAIARDIYPDPYCRTSDDIDLLIRQKDLKHADVILSRNGYVRHDRLPLEFLVNRLHHAIYYYPGTTDPIEVHWNFGIPSFFRLTSDDIWTETVQLGNNCYRLSPAMMVIHLLMHHYMHAFRELKILTDIIWALHRYADSLDISTFGQMMKHIGLAKTAAVTMSQIGMLCGKSATREPVLLKFRNVVDSMSRGESSLLTFYFRLNLDEEYGFQDKRDRFMSRFALDESRTILQSFVTSVFPLPEDLKHLYSDRRPWLLPMYYWRFLLWRLKEWTGQYNCPASLK